jgi:hypothetical protein
VAGFLPGFGRGGITHSLLVMDVLEEGRFEAAMLATCEPVPTGFIASGGVEDDECVNTLDRGEASVAGEEAADGSGITSLVGCCFVTLFEDKLQGTAGDAMLSLQ